MDEQQTRLAIKEAALSYMDKPYRHMGWGPNYYDCIGLVAQVGRDEGGFDGIVDPDIRAYSQDPDPEQMLRALRRYMTKLPFTETGVGDVLWFRNKKYTSDEIWHPMHLGIITYKTPDRTFVTHANIIRKKIVQSDVAGMRVITGWRYLSLCEAMA